MPTKKNQPQYAVIAQALINDIAKGKYPVGSLLPPELDMADQFKVSRNTMRSALRMLVDMGLVSRRAGRGTQVQTSQIQPNYTQTLEALSALFPAAANTEITAGTVQNVSANEDEARLLACAAGTSWLRFSVTRHQKSQTVSFSYFYVEPHLKQVKNRLARSAQLGYEALESVLGSEIQQVVQQCDATGADAVVAKALSVAEDSPVLRKVTRFVDEAGRVLMVTDTYTAPGQVHHTVHLRLNWASADVAE